jgi:phage gpG-like protein
MAVLIEVTFDDAEAGEAFSRLAALGGDLTPLMKAIADAGAAISQDRIRNTKTGPDGVKWKPNRAGTPTLFRSGALLLSISSRHDRDTASWGSDVPYAGLQQAGGTIKAKDGGHLKFNWGGGWASVKSVTVPARPYLGIGDPEREAIEDLVGTAIIAALSPNGGTASA